MGILTRRTLHTQSVQLWMKRGKIHPVLPRRTPSWSYQNTPTQAVLSAPHAFSDMGRARPTYSTSTSI